MSSKKRRNQSKSSHDEPVKKQKSIASFFAASNTSTQEEVTNEVVVSEEETTPPEPETNDKEVFFATSMYTDEVNDMINTILEGEKHLLSEEELLLLAQYHSLSDDPKNLLVRLIMRKHGWMRKKTLTYSRNIRDLDAAIDSLKDCNMISTSLDDLGEALNILLVEELREILDERNIKIPEQGKSVYAKKLLEFSATSTAGLVTNDTTINAKRIEKLWASIHERLGTCVKVKDPIYQLFKRLQIIFYRINSLQDTKAMSNSILAKTSKRNFPVYTPCRTNIIWNTREDFISYERALLIEDEFHKRIEKLSRWSPSPRNKRLKSPVANGAKLRQAMVDTWTICENCIGPWEDEIAIRGAHERPYYLRRFEAGWIYTRILDHGTEVLAKLHEYELEEVIVQKLLKQSLYRISKRGKWYDRLAVIQRNHVRKDQGRMQKKIALKTCSVAIQDPKVHQIFLFGLHRRIEQLERELCIPKREQHDFSYMIRKKPKAITIYGERLSDLEASGRKSIWRNDDGSECTVEQVAIEYYKKQGYKGLHCENGIVRMLVVLLFWDVIFAPIPGVFETPYQTEPFDLRTDSFYESRVDIIQDRLREIEDGKHLEIIETVDHRERPRQTMCMGINWKYEYQDIIEIAECIGASPLASLCKIYFQEFGQRQGGMPDLCCWDYEKKLCLFSEVKGPNDKLSKTQNEWIEALAGFGIPVEVCHVQVWRGEDVFLV